MANLRIEMRAAEMRLRSSERRLHELQTQMKRRGLPLFERQAKLAEYWREIERDAEYLRNCANTLRRLHTPPSQRNLLDGLPDGRPLRDVPRHD